MSLKDHKQPGKSNMIINMGVKKNISGVIITGGKKINNLENLNENSETNIQTREAS